MQGSTLSLIRSVVFRHGLRLLGRLAITLPMSVAAAETPPWDEDTLTGSWNGTRSSLFEKGIALEFTHRSDVLRNLEGGAHGWATPMPAACSIWKNFTVGPT